MLSCTHARASSMSFTDGTGSPARRCGSASSEHRRQLLDTALAHDGDGESVSGADPTQLIPQAVRLADRDALGLEDHVLAEDDRALAECRLDEAAAQAEARPGRLRNDALNEDAGAGQIQDLHQIVGQEQTVDAVPRRAALEHQLTCDVRGNGEAETLEAAGLRDDVTHDPEHLT